MVDVTRIECQYNIDTEADIDEVVCGRPPLAFDVCIGDTVRDQNADEYQFEKDEEVPDNLDWIILTNQKLGRALRHQSQIIIVKLGQVVESIVDRGP